MVALAAHRADLHSCGHPLSESTEPSAKYVAELPTRCYACDAIELKQEEYRDSPRPTALLWRASRR